MTIRSMSRQLRSQLEHNFRLPRSIQSSLFQIVVSKTKTTIFKQSLAEVKELCFKLNQCGLVDVTIFPVHSQTLVFSSSIEIVWTISLGP